MRRQAVALHDLAPDDEVEQLVLAAQLQIAAQLDGVVGLEQRVEELVERDRSLLSQALGEVVSL